MARRSGASKSKSVSKKKRKPASAPTQARTRRGAEKTKPKASEDQWKRAKLIAEIWANPELRARFRADPKGVLRRYKLEVPEKINIAVVEDTKDTMHIVIPYPPTRISERDWADGSELTVGDSSLTVLTIGKTIF